MTSYSFSEPESGRISRSAREVSSVRPEVVPSEPQSREKAGKKPDPIERNIQDETGSVSTKNKTEIYASGPDFFKTLEREIGDAKESIQAQ